MHSSCNACRVQTTGSLTHNDECVAGVFTLRASGASSTQQQSVSCSSAANGFNLRQQQRQPQRSPSLSLRGFLNIKQQPATASNSNSKAPAHSEQASVALPQRQCVCSAWRHDCALATLRNHINKRTNVHRAWHTRTRSDACVRARACCVEHVYHCLQWSCDSPPPPPALLGPLRHGASQHWKQAGKTEKCCTSLTNCRTENSTPAPVPFTRKKPMMRALSACTPHQPPSSRSIQRGGGLALPSCSALVRCSQL